MATLGTRNPTLRDLANGLKEDKTFDPDIVELCLEANPILQDVVVKEAAGENDRTTIRTGLPTPTWVAYYDGVQPAKGSKKQVSNAAGRMKSLIQVDADMADDSPNKSAEMADEAFAHAEAMGQDFCDALFYGNVKTNAKKFNGLAPIYLTYGGTDRQQSSFYCIASAARSGSPDNSALRSIYLVGWGRMGAYCFYPKGSKGGLQRDALKKERVTQSDGTRLDMYEQMFTWTAGLTVKDFRTCGRICNIESNNLATLDKDIGEEMLKLLTRCRKSGVKQVFYMPPTVYEWLCVKTRRQVLATTFGFKDIGGEQVLTFMGVPIRQCDALETNETAVTAAS